MIKKSIASILIKIAMLTLIGILVYIGVNHGVAIKDTIKQIQLNWLALFILLQFMMISLSGLAFHILSIPFEFHLKWYDWMGLSFIANFINQLLPYRPGMAFRFYYLKKNYGMPFKVFMWIMLIYLAFTFIIAGSFSISGWLYGELYMIDRNDILMMVLVIGAVFFAAFLIRILRNKFNQQKTSDHPIQKTLQNCLSAFQHAAIHPVYLVLSTFVFLSIYSTICLLFYLIFMALNHQVPITHCMFITGIMIFASIIPITAANIGVNESLVGSLTQLMYDDFSIGFSVTLIFRISQLIPGILLGSLFSFCLVGNIIPWKGKKIDES